MGRKSKLLFILVVGILLFSIVIKDACCVLNPVLIEFLYYEPCSVCPGTRKYYEVFLHNSRVVTNIQEDYGEKVIVKRIRFFSGEGVEKVKQYNLSFRDWNSIIVNHEVVLVGGDKLINETYLRQIINSYLEKQYPHDIAILIVEANSYTVTVGDTIEVSSL